MPVCDPVCAHVHTQSSAFIAHIAQGCVKYKEVSQKSRLSVKSDLQKVLLKKKKSYTVLLLSRILQHPIPLILTLTLAPRRRHTRCSNPLKKKARRYNKHFVCTRLLISPAFANWSNDTLASWGNWIVVICIRLWRDPESVNPGSRRDPRGGAGQHLSPRYSKKG